MRTTLVTEAAAAVGSVEVLAETTPVDVDPLDTVVTGWLPVTTWLTGLTDERSGDATSAITVPLNHLAQLRISSAVQSQAHKIIAWATARYRAGDDSPEIWSDGNTDCNWPN